ncbi:MAG TPA: FHA domain-containing protein [Myxococcales bacterium]
MAQLPLKTLYLEYLGAPSRFLDRHPHPWVVLASQTRPKEDLELKTSVYDMDADPATDDTPEALAETPATEVVKREINAFGLGITVGRTKNNDLWINDERISRFHAYFRLQDGGWMLSDAGSRNGTFMDGAQLDARRPKPLPERALLDFGGYRVRYFMPQAFIEFLRRVAPRPPPRLSRP